MSEVPFMPEAVARHFAQAVSLTARKVHRSWGHVFDFRDLEQEAWAIALTRWQLWSDQVPAARKDLEIHLRRWVDKRLPELGWKRVRTEGGGRRWVPAMTVLTYDPQNMSERHSAPWAVDDPEPGFRPLAADWAPMGRKKRERYARIVMQRYPVLVAEFEAIEGVGKPSNRSYAEWCQRRDVQRARLRVKWARELAGARYAVEGYGAFESEMAA
jgi:hypothetical protein